MYYTISMINIEEPKPNQVLFGFFQPDGTALSGMKNTIKDKSLTDNEVLQESINFMYNLKENSQLPDVDGLVITIRYKNFFQAYRKDEDDNLVDIQRQDSVLH